MRAAEVKVTPTYRPVVERVGGGDATARLFAVSRAGAVVPNGALLAVEGSRIAFRGQGQPRVVGGAVMQNGDGQPAALQD